MPPNQAQPSPEAKQRLGAVALLISGALFLAKSVLDLVTGDPPRTAPQLAEWARAHQAAIAWSNEVLVFAAVLLIPGILAIYRRLGGSGRPWAGFGCGLLAATVPLLLVVAMVQGRLVYPVYDLTPGDPSSLALVVTLYFGGAHEVAILLGGALIILGAVMARTVGWHRAIAVIGIVAGVAQIPGSYPWLIGPTLTWIAQALVAVWLALTGAQLLRPASRPR